MERCPEHPIVEFVETNEQRTVFASCSTRHLTSHRVAEAGCAETGELTSAGFPASRGKDFSCRNRPLQMAQPRDGAPFRLAEQVNRLLPAPGPGLAEANRDGVEVVCAAGNPGHPNPFIVGAAYRQLPLAEGTMTQLARTFRSTVRTASLAAAALGTTTGLIGGFMAPTASAAESTRPTYDNYVALGDSYASGAGLSLVDDADCDRTSESYPAVIAGAVKAKSFKNVTCSGATTAEMAKAQGTNPAQLSALSADTDLVTLTIGGNDIGFTEIITNCVVGSFSDPTGSPCKAHYNASGSDALTTRISSAAAKLTVTLQYIRALAPKARVLVVGYPSLVPDDGKACRPGVPFADGDVSYLRDVNKKLNQALAERARSAGAEYADTYTMTIGHDMCQNETDRWIEPLETKLAPAHPNRWGQHAMAYGAYNQLLN